MPMYGRSGRSIRREIWLGGILTPAREHLRCSPHGVFKHDQNAAAFGVDMDGPVTGTPFNQADVAWTKSDFADCLLALDDIFKIVGIMGMRRHDGTGTEFRQNDIG